MRYLQAALIVVVFTLAASIAFPRIAPIALRVGLIALIIIAAFWIYHTITHRPPPLASRALELIKARGPISKREVIQHLDADLEEVERALDYLAKRGAVRRFEKNGVEYYDV
ncbi:MAG: transcriptional regulator [Pyrobaculum sp.]